MNDGLEMRLRNLNVSMFENLGRFCEQSEMRSRKRKRTTYLAKLEEARRRGSCLVFMDETWVFDSMTKDKGWNDNTIPRFASAEVMRTYSCGKTVAKDKGRRAIVIGAITDEGAVPESTMVPTRSSTKSEIETYLRDKGVVVPENSMKAYLVEEVRASTQYMSALPSSLCQEWFHHVAKEEDATRLKIAIDLANSHSIIETIDSELSSSSDGDLELEADENDPNLTE
ncbi:unnamed protein product [Cylicocyclus nassatus]|uniref:Transposase n=1 Tax=Cylicocyclus nassatus TaxID=53992 RepID=A0AA36H126_CYLNA|nr:unnamed protein product [Cylicocyclus nassatus]